MNLNRVFHYFHHPFWGVKTTYFGADTHIDICNLGEFYQLPSMTWIDSPLSEVPQIHSLQKGREPKNLVDVHSGLT